MSSTPSGPRHRVRLRRPSKKTLLWLTLVVICFLAFEVTTRNLPPDGMTVTPLPSPESRTPRVTWYYNDPQYIGKMYDALNTAPTAFYLFPFESVCGTIGYDDYRVTFTWHGLPVEVWTNTGGCPDFMENSGGIPNLLWTRTLLPSW